MEMRVLNNKVYGSNETNPMKATLIGESNSPDHPGTPRINPGGPRAMLPHQGQC